MQALALKYHQFMVRVPDGLVHFSHFAILVAFIYGAVKGYMWYEKDTAGDEFEYASTELLAQEYGARDIALALQGNLDHEGAPVNTWCLCGTKIDDGELVAYIAPDVGETDVPMSTYSAGEPVTQPRPIASYEPRRQECSVGAAELRIYGDHEFVSTWGSIHRGTCGLKFAAHTYTPELRGYTRLSAHYKSAGSFLAPYPLREYVAALPPEGLLEDLE